MLKSRTSTYLIPLLLSCACQSKPKEELSQHQKDSLASCEMNLPARYGKGLDTTNIKGGKASHEGMIFIRGAEFEMGATDKEGRADEYPQHKVKLASYWIDATEVTNASFKKFVEATGYVTTAERKPDWEEMKKQLPPGTPKPPDSVFVAGSLGFYQPKTNTNIKEASQIFSSFLF